MRRSTLAFCLGGQRSLPLSDARSRAGITARCRGSHLPSDNLAWRSIASHICPGIGVARISLSIYLSLSFSLSTFLALSRSLALYLKHARHASQVPRHDAVARAPLRTSWRGDTFFLTFGLTLEPFRLISRNVCRKSCRRAHCEVDSVW